MPVLLVSNSTGRGFLLILNRNFSRSAEFPKLGTSSRKSSKNLSQDSSYALHVNKLCMLFVLNTAQTVGALLYRRLIVRVQSQLLEINGYFTTECPRKGVSV